MVPASPPLSAGDAVVQSAVNFSEGRRADVIAAIAAAASGAPGAVVADWSADPDHNRMVVSLLGAPDAVAAAVVEAARVAVERIDLRRHVGAHPRSGAIDVVPVTPARNTSMEDCVRIADCIGRRLADTLGLPVYFYERSAGPGRRVSLPEIRKGGFEGLFTGPLTGDRAPDCGPSEPHPTAGAVVVGARGPLVAYNVNLDTESVTVARSIAAAIRREREWTPCLAGVRALGMVLASRQRAQVSMNLTRPKRTTMPAVFDWVRRAGAEAGADACESEVIGLTPRSCLGGEAPARILWRAFHETQILEYWLGPQQL